jgi:hypothetical protein
VGIGFLAATLVIEVPFRIIFGAWGGNFVSLVLNLFFIPFAGVYFYNIFQNLRALKPHLADAKTRTGVGFITTSAIVGLVVPVVIIAASIFFGGLAVLRNYHFYQEGGDFSAPAPGYNAQAPWQQ